MGSTFFTELERSIFGFCEDGFGRGEIKLIKRVRRLKGERGYVIQALIEKNWMFFLEA